MRALIFGISGQDGFYLNALLKQKEIEVIAVSRSSGNWLTGDVAIKQTVENLIREYKPDFVFHLAANSTTRHEALFENHETITTGSLNILEACYKFSKGTRIFLSGSAVQFQNKGDPIDEASSFAPLSPYAVSRIASVYAGRYYRSLGLKVYVGYFFNHDSPLRTERHVNQKIISAVKRIAKGSNEIIEIRDIAVKKEFNFAGDVVEAIWILMQQENHYEAVIGTGKAYSIEDWIKICFNIVRLDWKKYVTEKQDFVSEYNTLVSDPKLIMSLGWKQKTSIEQLAQMMYHSN